MVSFIYFMKPLLVFIFGKLLIKVKNKVVISLIFSFAAAFLSAFLDALTVTAVLITVFVALYGVYEKVHSTIGIDFDHDGSVSVEDLKQSMFGLYEFLRNFDVIETTSSIKGKIY